MIKIYVHKEKMLIPDTKLDNQNINVCKVYTRHDQYLRIAYLKFLMI